MSIGTIILIILIIALLGGFSGVGGGQIRCRRHALLNWLFLGRVRDERC